jgi:hypothetical protein
MMPVSGKRGLESEGISYGAVGWVRDTISVGWPAMRFHIGFYALLWGKLYRRRMSLSCNYGKALHFGCNLGFAAYFLLYFVYLDAFVLAGWFTFVQLYFTSLILSPKRQNDLLFVPVTRLVLRSNTK